MRRPTSSRAPAATFRTSSITTVVPTATSGGFGFFQDQDFNRNVVKGDVTMYLSGHDIKVGGDYEHINAINNNYNGGAGQRIYKFSTRRGWRGDRLLPPSLLCERSRGRVRRERIRPPGRSRCRSPPSRIRPTRRSTRRTAGRSGELLHDQRRHPLGSAGRPQPRSASRRSSSIRTGRHASASSGT